MAKMTIQIDPEKLHAAVATGRAPEPCALVIFGGTGDLARRKLVPALYNLSRDGALPDGVSVIGIGLDAWTPDAFRATHREATAKFSRSKPLDEKAWESFARRLDYLSGDLAEASTYAALGEKLKEGESQGTRGNRLFYCAVPASVFPVILRGLVQAGLIRKVEEAGASPWQRLIIEKPFGRDLQTSRELNRLAADSLDESQLFRIDHYLGKETVQNLLVFRFGNAIFEPLWNRKYIDHVQVTAAEDMGIEGRGRFYDETGVVRDIVQNHLLQVLALCAMEAPVSFEADEIRDEKAQVFRSLRPFAPSDVDERVVLGQYRGYREEPNVGSASCTPTFAALKVFIDNWRWQGVPFYLRAGKRLAKRATEVAIHFQSVPLLLFKNEGGARGVEPNVLVIRIQPDEGITLRFACKVPGEGLKVSGVSMDFSYAQGFNVPVHEAYEHLLLDTLRGDATLFWRRDEVSRAWEFVGPILEAGARCSVFPYEPGSAGPKEADALLARDGRAWRPLA
ncbi:glucose-6-phosphate dehydrogenase [bacterium]|nr:glucose-6-phosphate dehydrogenase [bacterium]